MLIKKGDKVIASKSKFCNSLFSKAIGLRFRKKPVDTGLIFTFNSPQIVLMDMWFVFYPIDVVFLDNDKKVVEIKENFLPFAFYNSKKEALFIIELENGAVRKNNIQIDDKIEF